MSGWLHDGMVHVSVHAAHTKEATYGNRAFCKKARSEEIQFSPASMWSGRGLAPAFRSCGAYEVFHIAYVAKPKSLLQFKLSALKLLQDAQGEKKNILVHSSLT